MTRKRDTMITYEDIKVVISIKVRCNKEVRKYLNDYITQQETLQTEHEALKKDVARYFETRNRLKTILPNANDITEFWNLEDKLSKVGKEE